MNEEAIARALGRSATRKRQTYGSFLLSQLPLHTLMLHPNLPYFLTYPLTLQRICPLRLCLLKLAWNASCTVWKQELSLLKCVPFANNYGSVLNKFFDSFLNYYAYNIYHF
jgi:hypothetical protein